MLRKIRTNNRRFIDRTFLEDTYDSGQQVEFYGIGAYYQNSISERDLQTIVENARTILLYYRHM